MFIIYWSFKSEFLNVDWILKHFKLPEMSLVFILENKLHNEETANF